MINAFIITDLFVFPETFCFRISNFRRFKYRLYSERAYVSLNKFPCSFQGRRVLAPGKYSFTRKNMQYNLMDMSYSF